MLSFIVAALAFVVPPLNAIHCHPYDHQPSRLLSHDTFPVVTNGSLITGNFRQPERGGGIIFQHNLKAAAGTLVADHRDYLDLLHSGSQFQILDCDVDSSWSAVPSMEPFRGLEKNISMLAGLLSTDDKCLTVKDSALSWEECATAEEQLAPQWFHFIGNYVVYAGRYNGTAARATFNGDKLVSFSPPSPDEQCFPILSLIEKPLDIGNTRQSSATRPGAPYFVLSATLIYSLFL